MKKKSNGRSAFFNLRLLIALLVLVSGMALAMFADGRPKSRKPSSNVTQKQTLTAGAQQPDQAFWAQTNGPQGGDGIALATSPSGHIFVGTQGGGVFRSTDD